jgi:hypothetical protein
LQDNQWRVGLGGTSQSIDQGMPSSSSLTPSAQLVGVTTSTIPKRTDILGSLGANNGPFTPHAKAPSQQDCVDEHENAAPYGVEAESHATPAPMTITTLRVKMANARTI